MATASTLKDLRIREMATLKARVERRIKIKPGPKRVRRIVGVNVVLTQPASKVHICACVMSFPKLEVLEEAIATDDIDEPMHEKLGNVVFVPFILSVLKMLKRKADVIMIRELSVKEEIPLSSYAGVISGKPAIGFVEKVSSMKRLSKWDDMRRAGLVKVRGHKTPIGVIAGHLMTLKDASSLCRSCAKDARIPSPIRDAGMRVRAWEREWKRVNIERR